MRTLLAGAAGMVVLGTIDDRRDLKPGPKLLGQFLIAALVLFVQAICILAIVTLLEQLGRK